MMPLTEVALKALETAKAVGEAVQDGVVAIAEEIKGAGVEGLKKTATEAAESIKKKAPVLDRILRKQYNLEHVRDWIGEINPNYDPFDYRSPYNSNCGSCALSVFKRLEGEGDFVATAQNIPYNHQMEALTGLRQVRLSGPEEIRRILQEQGPGAHAIIGIDRAQGPGHWFNVANIDNKIVAIDGQVGQVTDFPPDDLGDVIHWEMSMKA